MPDWSGFTLASPEPAATPAASPWAAAGFKPVSDTPSPAPEQPGLISSVIGAGGAGIAQSVRDIAAAPSAIQGKPQAQTAAQPDYTQPLAWGDLLHPTAAAPKISYQLGKSVPQLAGGIAGGIAGGALASETGPGAALGTLGGGALGAGAVSAVQSLAPYFAEEMGKPGASPDAAFKAALGRAGQEGAISAAGWALFGVAPFKSAVKNILFQAAGVQPALAVAQTGLENVEQGRPVTEGMAQAIPGAVVGTAVPMAGHAAVTHLMPERTPATAPVEPTPTAPRTPEQIENEDGLSPELAAQVAAQQPVEAQDQRARDALAAKVTTPAPEPQPEPVAPAESAPAPQTSAYTMLRPNQLRVDPERFQYKASDERGVTGALAGTTKWEPALANPITAWQDTDGQLYVVNGHQRTDLATRAEAAGQPDVQIPARIFRAEDGYSPEYMRALGAYQNIAEGSGTAIDAAKVIRSASAFPPDMTLPDLPPKQAMVVQGRALAKLSPEAFGVVENGIVPAAFAASVGDRISDPREQMAALDVLARAQPANAEQARIMVDDIRNSGFLNGTQTTLFGDEAFAQSLVPERARILDNAMRTLRRVKGVFRAAVEGEDTLTGAGNTLDTAGNIKGKSDNERLLDTISRDATTKGPLSDALSDAARDLAAGKTIAAVTPRFLAAARSIVARGPEEGIQPRADVGGAGLEGETGRVEDENQSGFLERRPPLPPQSGAPLFDVHPKPRAQPARTEQDTLFPQSAVQAQAARDQAGRGALMGKVPQKGVGDLPMFDTGARAQGDLLGTTAVRPPKEIVAPDISGHATQDFRDFVKTRGVSGAPADVHAAAADYVMARGRETGREYLTSYDPRGNQVTVATTSGEGSFVAFTPEMAAALNDPSQVVLSHHNHPGNSSLSLADIAASLRPGAADVVAHGHDGTFYAVHPGPRLEPKPSTGDTKGATGTLASVHAEYVRRITNSLQNDVGRRFLNGSDANHVFWHAVNSALHESGWINYMSSRVLEPRLEDATQRAIAAATEGEPYAGIDRPPIAVRPDEGMARVLARAQELAAQRQATSADQTGDQGRGRGLGEEPAPEFRQDRDRLKARELPLPRPDEMSTARKVVDEIHTIFSPTSRPGAKPMEQLVRRNAAEQAQNRVQATDALQKYGNEIARLPVADQLDITHRREAGLPQRTPALDNIMSAMRAQQAKVAQLVRSLGPEYLPRLIENYMGRIYSNYPEWARGEAPGTPPELAERLRASYAAAASKGPIRGSGNFLKERTFSTLREAMDAGLIPVTTNPIEMQLLKIYEGLKFYHGTKMANEIKANGLAHWVPVSDEGSARAAGWTKLDDSVFQPRVTAEGGRQEFGNWWAPDAAASIFNNYVSKGLGGSTIYQGVRQAGNALNSMQLGLSGFHATFMAFETMIDKVAMGLRQLARGDIARGAGSMLSGFSPTSIYSTFKKGSALMAAYRDPASAPPELRKQVDALLTGGGRARMDPFYQTNAAGTFFRTMADLKNPAGAFHDAWQMAKDTPMKAPLAIAARLIDTINHPLMGVLVPTLKLGVFSDMATDFLRAHPDATHEQYADAMTKAWDSVDNRMGQLVYDNLFWKKTMKDLAFITTRSVGWNLGSLREIGGGIGDSAKYIADAARGRDKDFTHRMAYTFAMPIVTALYGAILTKVITGKDPEDLLDYFYPPSGKESTPGVKDRYTLPGYIKDVMAFKNDPFGTLGNKTSPLLATAIELAKNRDYYGGIIYNAKALPGVPADNPLVTYPEYLANQVLPFSVRGFLKANAEGRSGLEQALNFWGINPAPQSIVNPAKSEGYEDRQRAMAIRARAKAEAGGHRISFGASP